jgi:hypothetical protein
MKKGNWKGPNPGSGAVYGLGLIGALVYFIQHAATFGDGVIGVLKALVWPAFLIYKVLEILKF